MKICDVYRSIQGEGPLSGRSAIFLRTYGCNLAGNLAGNCDLDCDSKYTWEGGDYDEMGADEVAELILDKVENEKLLVITGGEPMVQESEFLGSFWDYFYRNINELEWLVETNGTILPKEDWSDYWSVSPHSSIDYKRWLTYNNVYFKFVCSKKEDFDYVNDIVEKKKIPRDKVWLMPEGYTKHDLRLHGGIVVEEAIARGYNYSDRLQIRIWGNVRGT